MFKVGITGGIGSGKTTISQIFHSLGVPVYDSDSRGKELLVSDGGVKEQVLAAFGEEAYQADGSVNKGFLSERVFSDNEALEMLNSIVHPAVRTDLEKWLGQQHSPYVLKEAAILIESGAYKELDEIIVVEADAETRIRRVMARDQVGDDKVKERMNAQLTDEKRRAYATYIIDANEDQLVIPQVLKIHEDIISKASS